MNFNWQSYFPFEKPRQIQINAINFILNSFFNLNKKFVICELPTGSGKSAIAITILKYFKEYYNDNKLTGWILTPQKILQQQYLNEFSFLSNIWSKNNYLCKKFYGISCQCGLLLNSILNKNFCDCIYFKDKEDFLKNEFSITNLLYFLNLIEYESILKRKLLIIDEAHNIESSIINFISLKLNKFILEKYNIIWKNTEFVIDWIKDDILPILYKNKENINNLIKSNNSSNSLKNSYTQELIKEFNELDLFINKIEMCIKNFNENEWIINKNENEIEIKPIYVSQFTEKLFSVADKILLMSGTILDKNLFCKINNIPIEETEFISFDSPFNKENRMIYFLNVGFLNYKNIDKNLEKICLIINDIINEYKNEKGIIHCHSYKIANYIYNNIKPSHRFLINNTNNILKIYNLHLENKKPTILLSPSFKEGIDLKDDFSRFQIIIKMPFPDLGNLYIKEKMKKMPEWYNWETAKNLIQSSGRSIRHENDYSNTYILDSNFKTFLKKNKYLFPKWFLKSIINV